MISEALLESELNKLIAKKNIFSAVLAVESGDGRFSWTGAAGSMQKDSRFFRTKFFFTQTPLDSPVAGGCYLLLRELTITPFMEKLCFESANFRA